MNRAVFLDRDGVINKLVFNPKTGEYESPHRLEDLELMYNVLEPIKRLENNGYYLFVISNQPSYAKGKTTLGSIKNIQEKLEEQLEQYGITFKEYYYCYHHPNGIVPGFSGECECRKPKHFFIDKAKNDYDLNLSQSWMIGDQDVDIECGNNAGVKTIMILNEYSSKKRGSSFPNYSVNNLSESVNIILKSSDENNKRS